MRLKAVPLRSFAYSRSGDKGSDANIGLAAESFEAFELLQKHVTKEAVAAFFALLRVKSVKRYALPQLFALNFVLEEALDGGAAGSLRIDSQGKALGQALLEMELSLTEEECKSIGL